MALAISVPRALLGGVLGTAAGILTARLLATAIQVRARPLTVLADGLVLTREGCQTSVPWRDLEEIRREKFRRAGVDRRIQPGLYVADWRNSPIGAGCPAC